MEGKATMKMTQAQYDYVVAHLNDRPRRKVAEAAGIGLTTLYRIVRERGGELRHELSTKYEGIEEAVRRFYPSMSASEMSARFGWPVQRINKWAWRLGVRHNEETLGRIRRQELERLAEARRRTDQAAKARKWKRRRRADELRFLSGQPQETRFRFGVLGKDAYKMVWWLVRKRNYFRMEGEPRTLYYDGETERSPNEGRLAEKYRLEFRPAADYEEQQDKQH